MKPWIIAIVLALGLSAEAGAVELNWQDNSNLEEGFIIETLQGGTWAEAGRVGPNITTFKDSNAEGVYRIRAFIVAEGVEVVSAPSNTAAKLNAPLSVTAN